ncbi:modification methylase [Thermoplasma volcanium GSS1]|uniref:site-specific DNA-methyltransferase (cytosine-N(4)-specific) n=2 Tax=Thermoplasma volcanium TaxID=50339 RepID=Q978H3_THEVO|nr:modification methylase [Thermoplasma volcanium GSS1]
MIPQVARKLLYLYGSNAKTVFDPYCGTGTSLVEAMLLGINGIGTDLNPLAQLIAKAKTNAYIDYKSVISEIEKFNENADKLDPIVPNIKNIDFWFSKNVSIKLGKIKAYIESIEDENIKQFFMVAFSETVRESSNARKDEFKLVRYKEYKLKNWNPDPFEIINIKLNRNLKGLIDFKKKIASLNEIPYVKIYNYNSVNEIPNNDIPEDFADIVVTSPPYGDSHTTVAYGQYSRLSSEWLSLIGNENIDNKLMGGSKSPIIEDFPSLPLNEAIQAIEKKNKKRAIEVSSFYRDLQMSIKNVGRVLKSNGYACYVVANRTVNSVILPTSYAIKDIFEYYGFEYIKTYIRDIPNKRMPSVNSPTNVAGETSKTMLKEHIVVMKKM